MKLLSHGPEPCASANSAIPAYYDVAGVNPTYSALCDFDIVSQKNRFVNGRNAKIIDFLFRIPPRSTNLHFGEEYNMLIYYYYILKGIGGS